MCSVHSTNILDINFTEKRGHISGNSECGTMTTEEWDQKMLAMCSREYGPMTTSHNVGEETTLESQQACAEEALKTEGAGHWMYNWKMKWCKLKPSDVVLVDNVYKQVIGNRECGFLSLDQWDKMLSADCKREYDRAFDLSLSEPIKVVNAPDQRACAEKSKTTSGAVFWAYDLKTTECHLMDGQGTKVEMPGKVLGNYECSVLNEEQWDALLAEDCQRDPASKISFSEEALLLTRKVQDEEACARLTTETQDGLFWSFSQEDLTCHVVSSVDGKVGEIGWNTGNRACGLLSPAQWDLVIPTLKPEDRLKLGNYLTAPQNCPSSPESQNIPDINGHVNARASKSTPIIDLFLNPSRSVELNNMLKISAESGAGVVPQVLFIASQIQLTSITVCNAMAPT